jgi:hypothetical protein
LLISKMKYKLPNPILREAFSKLSYNSVAKELPIYSYSVARERLFYWKAFL